MFREKGKFSLMALPQSLHELSELFELPIVHIPVTCYYCSCNLTFPDKVLFAFSGLALHWHNLVYYASCQACLRGVARLDFLTGYEDLKGPREIERIFSKPFRDLRIRCFGCYRHLNLTEKEDVLTTNENVAIVRGEPKALCILCKIGVP